MIFITSSNSRTVSECTPVTGAISEAILLLFFLSLPLRSALFGVCVCVPHFPGRFLKGTLITDNIYSFSNICSLCVSQCGVGWRQNCLGHKITFLVLHSSPFTITCIVSVYLSISHINMYVISSAEWCGWCALCTVCVCFPFMSFPAPAIWTFFGLFFFFHRRNDTKKSTWIPT